MADAGTLLSLNASTNLICWRTFTRLITGGGGVVVVVVMWWRWWCVCYCCCCCSLNLVACIVLLFVYFVLYCHAYLTTLTSEGSTSQHFFSLRFIENIFESRNAHSLIYTFIPISITLTFTGLLDSSINLCSSSKQNISTVKNRS